MYVGIGILFLWYGYFRAIRKPQVSLILTVISLGTRWLCPRAGTPGRRWGSSPSGCPFPSAGCWPAWRAWCSIAVCDRKSSYPFAVRLYLYWQNGIYQSSGGTLKMKIHHYASQFARFSFTASASRPMSGVKVRLRQILANPAYHFDVICDNGEGIYREILYWDIGGKRSISVFCLPCGTSVTGKKF